MSHWTMAKISLKNVNRDILKKALEMIAKNLNTEVVEDFIVEGYGVTQKCEFGLPMKLPYGNGFGVSINDNDIVIVGDEHGAPITTEELKKEVLKNYLTVAVAIAAEELGFKIEEYNESKEIREIILSRW